MAASCSAGRDCGCSGGTAAGAAPGTDSGVAVSNGANLRRPLERDLETQMGGAVRGMWCCSRYWENNSPNDTGSKPGEGVMRFPVLVKGMYTGGEEEVALARESTSVVDNRAEALATAAAAATAGGKTTSVIRMEVLEIDKGSAALAASENACGRDEAGLESEGGGRGAFASVDSGGSEGAAR